MITSDQFTDPRTKLRRIQITRVLLSDDGRNVQYEEINRDYVPMANGGVNYNGGVLFCAQGTQDRPGGLAFSACRPPYTSHLTLSSFQRRNFSSVNDVVIRSEGLILFTDPIYGCEHGSAKRKIPVPSVLIRFCAQLGWCDI